MVGKRGKLIAGNWKANVGRVQADALLTALSSVCWEKTAVEWVIFPPFLALHQAACALKETPIKWGAQTLSVYESGAYTGEVSGEMLKGYGCTHVMIGHSERRHLLGEGDEAIRRQLMQAFAWGLVPVLCVGETRAEHARGETMLAVRAQLEGALRGICHERDDFSLVVAYEPVWAIGTGLAATPAQVQSAHAFIRDELLKKSERLAQETLILYGGSVKPENAAGLFELPDVDGALIGGASLSATDFIAIGRVAS